MQFVQNMFLGNDVESKEIAAEIMSSGCGHTYSLISARLSIDCGNFKRQLETVNASLEGILLPVHIGDWIKKIFG